MQLALRPSLLLTFALVLSTPGLCAEREKKECDAKAQIDSFVEKLLEHKRTIGVAAALIDGDEVQELYYGSVKVGSQEKPNKDTLFEIGSITKTFTGAALQRLADEGKINLDDPAQKYAPAGVQLPTCEGKVFTLGQLAAHTSGLPRIPKDLPVKADPSFDSYAHYTSEQMYRALGGIELGREPGTVMEYSNLGAGLLGHLLANSEGKSIETLICEQICRPLEMKDTIMRPSETQLARHAQGHTMEGKPVGLWEFKSLQGAGALRSTLADMVRYARANLGKGPPEVVAALQSTHEPKFASEWRPLKVGMDWFICNYGDTGVVCYHSGGTGGFYSYIGFNKKTGRGLILLANSALSLTPIDDRLLAFLAGDTLRPFGDRKKAIVGTEILQEYAGQYQVPKGPLFEITVFKTSWLGYQKVGHFALSAIYATSQNTFAFIGSDTTIQFNRDKSGKVTSLTMHTLGTDIVAPRVADAAPSGPAKKYIDHIRQRTEAD